MDNKLECMCLKCGISLYVLGGEVELEDSEEIDRKMVTNRICDCGGHLFLIGKAEHQSKYQTCFGEKEDTDKR